MGENVILRRIENLKSLHEMQISAVALSLQKL